MNPKVTCGAIIRQKDNVLLTKRNIEPFKDYWCLPGGHVEENEKVIDAIKRETKEETGLDFKPVFFSYYDEIISKIKWHAVVLIFTGDAAGEIKREEKEVKEIRWFSKREIENIKLAFNRKKILKDYFRNV
jgi:8-oxo-dGTP diphosphatase